MILLKAEIEERKLAIQKEAEEKRAQGSQQYTLA